MTGERAGEQAAETDALEIAVAEAINPDWNKGAAITERMALDQVERVLRAVSEWLTSDGVVYHIENWVPLGFDYPAHDPFPHVTAAARAIVGELASRMGFPPEQQQP